MRSRWPDSLPVMRMTPAQFRALADYSASLPTGTTPGKMWRRLDGAHDRSFLKAGGQPRWVVGQYDPHCAPDAKRIKILWFRPIISVRAA